MDDAYLISIVARYEELYNLNHSQYSNQQRRDSIWEEIGTIMKQEGCVCKERWTRIRDNFRKALILRRTKIGKAACKIKAPKFNRELSFLVPYLTDEENRRPIKSGSDTEDETILSSIQSNIRNTDRPSSPSPVTITYTPVYSPDCDIQNTIPNFTNREQVCVANSSLQENHSSSFATYKNLDFDPLTDFFLTMARTVKTFPIQEQLKIKAELFQAVNNAELRLATANDIVTESIIQSSVSQYTSPERPSSRKTNKRERNFSENDNS